MVEISYAAPPATLMPVHAGKQVSYALRGIPTVRSADLSAVMAWRRGQIVFCQQALTELTEAVNRYRPGRLRDSTARRCARRPAAQPRHQRHRAYRMNT